MTREEIDRVLVEEHVSKKMRGLFWRPIPVIENPEDVEEKDVREFARLLNSISRKGWEILIRDMMRSLLNG